VKNLFEIDLNIDGQIKGIYFGIPELDEEIQEMYSFRYKSYLKHNYIDCNEDEKDIDEYDRGQSVYFVAKIDGNIIGTVRLIKEKYLPTEKDCFNFLEPKAMQLLPRENRGEVGRLIIEKYKDDIYLPRHLILIGLFYCVLLYSNQNGIRGGYSFIKNTLKIKLEKLKFPFCIIDEFKQIYGNGVLKKYFSNQDDKVWPIYYIVADIEKYLNKIINNIIIFKIINSNKVFLRSKILFNLYIWLHAL
jgi:N-acyl-L-homoserine lactone synthetase